MENYSSLKGNVEKYIYPDGTEVSYDIIKKEKEFNQENNDNKDNIKDKPPLCQECGNHLAKLNLDNNEYGYCPKCGQKTLKQKEIHVTAYIE